MGRWTTIIFVLAAALLSTGCKHIPATPTKNFSHFIGIGHSSEFTQIRNDDGSIVLLSRSLDATIFWNQLIVSWNADAPPGTFVKLEAAATGEGCRTKFYTLAEWSPDAKIFPRTSVPKQKDADGTVATDTLVLNHLATAAQIRVTLGGTNGELPRMKFLGLSFANALGAPASYGQVSGAGPRRQGADAPSLVPTPEHSQHGYPHANGWCSPAALAMVLAHWAEVLHRPELDIPIPQVADAVYDQAYAGTGNWPFNTAFAGSFPGMKAYITRFDDLAEVEDWINAGIPVILSARWDWLRPGRPFDAEGHLIVVVGFTENGDVIVNDPAARLDRGESIRQIYRRAYVVHAWSHSHNAVYLVYPSGTKIPANRCDHWEN